MLIIILGASKSGKSKIAEDYIVNMKDVSKRYYLATMECYSDEARIAIERHRQMRKDKGFITIEKNKDVLDVEIDNKDSVILLECMGNLVANEMFSDGFKENVSEKIISDIQKLNSKCKHLVIVSNIVNEDGISYSYETEKYIDNIVRINKGISLVANEVVEAVCGIPYKLK